MHRFLKIFLLWLLALALPLQGFATTMKISCGPAMPHQLVMPAAQHHEAAVQHDHQADAGHATHDGAHDTSHHLDTACCAGAVMLPSPLAWHAAHQRIAFARAPGASLFSGHIPSGLKRPPRTVLA